MTIESEVAALANASEDDLLRNLGMELVGAQGFPLDPAELIERGSRWVQAQSAALQDKVCASEGIRAFVQTKEPSDIVGIAIELAKLLASVALPVNPVALAVLLAKRGVKSLCEVRWKQVDGR
jgi:hypothetical protein